jgi:hypothetical protein
VFVPGCLELITDLHSGGLATSNLWFEVAGGRLHSRHVGPSTPKMITPVTSKTQACE